MLKSIGDKDDKMEFTSIQFFNMMTDEDFIAVHEAGQLTNLCLALSLDLQTQNHGKNKTYSAWMVWCFKSYEIIKRIELKYTVVSLKY